MERDEYFTSIGIILAKLCKSIQLFQIFDDFTFHYYFSSTFLLPFSNSVFKISFSLLRTKIFQNINVVGTGIKNVIIFQSRAKYVPNKQGSAQRPSADTQYYNSTCPSSSCRVARNRYIFQIDPVHRYTFNFSLLGNFANRVLPKLSSCLRVL